MNTEPELLNERLERLAMVLDEIMPNCALLVRDALELLKEQEAIVRCKDCKHYTLGVSGLDGYCEEWMRKTDGNEFFCADGEKRTD